MATSAPLCVTIALLAAGSMAVPVDERVQVFTEFANHPALEQLDLTFCGAFSHSQMSRGPIGCGFPEVGDHPWLVALGFRRLNGEGLFYACSGVLLTTDIVLTSARCAQGTPDYPLEKVRLGEFDLSTKKDCLWSEPRACQFAQEIDVASKVLHPDYLDRRLSRDSSRGSHPNDLALVRLETPVEIDLSVQTICLPIFAYRDPPRKQFSLSFGLNKGQSLVVDDATSCCDCSRDRAASANIMDEEAMFNHNNNDNGTQPCHYRMLGADGADSHGDRCVGSGTPCMADMGSPLVGVDRFGAAYYVLGVTSTRPAHEECSKTGVSVHFASVSNNIQWILDSIHHLQSGKTPSASTSSAPGVA